MHATPAQGRLPADPGVYQIRGDDPLYFVALAEVADDQGRIVGERYLPDGTLLLTVELGLEPRPDESRVARAARAMAPATRPASEGGVSRRSNPEHRIRIGSNFYLSALKDYYDWEEKWWREAIQNAVDAGAKNIALTEVLQPDGSRLIVCEDDGKGMTEEVLLDKFLVLGGTTKAGESGGVGGFGKAKELLLLPWMRWSVEVSGKKVEGQGDGYDLQDAPPRKGVRLEVLMPADKYTTLVQAKSFLARCDLRRVNVTTNGEVFNNWTRVTKKIRDFGGKGTLYAKKVPYGSAILVRARGIYMFRVHLDWRSRVVAVLEITGPSTEVLTANRDGFRDRHLTEEVERFQNEVSKDVLSAINKKSKRFEKKYLGTGTFKAQQKEHQRQVLLHVGDKIAGKKKASEEALEEAERLLDEQRGEVFRAAEKEREVSKAEEEAKEEQRKASEEEQRKASEEEQRKASEEEPEQKSEQKSEQKPEPPVGLDTSELVTSGATGRELLNSMDFLGASHQTAAILQLVWKPDFFIVNEIDNFKVPKIFMPETMSPSVLRLVRVWTELCRFVLMQLNCPKPFGVGLWFSEQARAVCKHDDGIDWLMLNPYVKIDERSAIYRPTNDDDLAKLYSIAIHECTHISPGATEHDEVFASAMTDNVAQCASGWKSIKKIAATIPLRKGKDIEDKTLCRGPFSCLKALNSTTARSTTCRVTCAQAATMA